MSLVVSFVLFCLFSFFSFYFPGNVCSLLLFKKEKPSLVFTIASGIVIFILGIYLFSVINMPYGYLAIILVTALYALWKRSGLFSFQLHIDRISLGIIIVGSIAFSLLSVFSGVVSSEGTRFIGLNAVDGITHLSYIKNQLIYFPPQHPELVGVPLRGYHYFYDFLVSRFVLFFKLSPEDLFFRFFPILISLFYGFSFFELCQKMTKNILAQRWILFLIYFSSGLSSFIAFFNHTFNPLTAQPIDIILDPSIVLGISLFVISITYLPKVAISWGYTVILGLMVGMLAQVKVYVGLTGIGVTLLYSLYGTWKSDWWMRMRIGVYIAIVALVTAVTFLPNNANSGRFIFAPLNFYDQFMQQSFFNFTHWGLRKAIYLQHHNIPRLALMGIESVVIFWMLNLGIRLIILLKIKQLFTKSFWQDTYNILILGAIVISAFVPSVFLQSPSPFEVMQFTWITLILLAIPTGLVLGDIMTQVGRFWKILLVVSVLCLSLPYVIFLEYQYFYPQNTIVFSSKQMKVFAAVAQEVSTTGYYVVLPDRLTYTAKDGYHVDKLLWIAAPLTTAMTGRSSYFEGNATPFVRTTLQDFREKNIFTLSDALQNCDIKATEKILQKIGSKTVLTYYPQPCWATSSAVLIKQETSKYSYYQFR